jgi:hypothetical protein
MMALPLNVVAIDHGQSLVQRFRELGDKGNPEQHATEFRRQVLGSLTGSPVGFVCGADLLHAVQRHGIGDRAVFGLPDLQANQIAVSRDWLVDGVCLAAGSVAAIKLSLVFGDNPLREVDQVVDTIRWLAPMFELRGLGLVLEASFSEPPRGSLVYEGIASALSDANPTLIKVPFPNVQKADEDGACRRITEACGMIPWVLLSGGCDFPTFRDRLDLAVLAGCSGFIAGSAIWKDAVDAPDARSWLRWNLERRVAELAALTSAVQSTERVGAAA